ncbi:MAG TPA: hypothetical protein VFU02_04745 [Polyangiaceae bacterium]|nr:hypothetical protein [Polyangiaceae bacterium]
MRRMITVNKARTDRWKREDEAPRLKEKAPMLASLRLELEEFSEGHSIVGTRRVTLVVIDHAAALFEIPCSDPKCEEGGHEITREVLSELAKQPPRFEIESGCHGYMANRPCGRTLRVIGQAEYKTAP